LETNPPDNSPADGWELLYKNVGGLLPSGRTEYVDAPSFALYNRYTGQVRTFVYHPTDVSGSFQTAKITASYFDRSKSSAYPKGSAIFSYMNTPSKALDRFYGFGNSASGYNLYVDSGVWSTLDFVTAYDPCVCENPSRVYVETVLQENQDIEMDITGTSDTEPVIENGEPQSALQRGFNIASNILGLAGSGLTSFGSVQSYHNKIDDIDEDSNKSSGVTIPGNLVPSWLGVGKATIDLLKFFVGGKGTSSRIVGYTTEFDLNATGTIEINDFANPSTFNTPSSLAQNGAGYQNGSNAVYGNPLGVFNLLKTPKLHRLVNQNATDLDRGTDWYYYVDGDELEYVVNTSAGFQSTPRRIMLSIVFENCSGNPYAMRLLTARQGGSIRTPFVDIGCSDGQFANFHNQWIRSDGPFGVDDIEFNECSYPRYLQVLVTLVPTDGSEDVVFMGSYEMTSGNSTNISSPPARGFYYDQTGTSPCSFPIVGPVSTNALQSFCQSQYDATRVNPDAMVQLAADVAGLKPPTNSLVDDGVKVSIYPNPFIKDIRVSSTFAADKVELLNSSGQIVFESGDNPPDAKEFYFNIPELIPGTYHLRLTSANRSETVSIVKAQ